MDIFANGLSLALVLDILRRRLWIAVALFSVLMVVLVNLIVFLPNVYTASAFILVEGQQVPQSYVRSTVTMGVERRLQAITQEILSRSRLDQLAQQFGLYEDLERAGAAGDSIATALRRDIGIQIKGKGSEIGGDTVAFEVSYTGPDQQKVGQVANTLASFYIEENLKVREQQALGTSEFLRAELEEVKKKLEAQEQHVAQYKRQYIGQLPEQLNSNLSTLTLLQKQMEILSESLAKAKERRSLLARRATETPGVKTKEGVDQATTPAPIEILRSRLAQLQTRFFDKHPDVVQLKAEIAAREEALKSYAGHGQAPDTQAPRTISKETLSVQAEQAEVDAEVGRLTAELKKVQKKIVAYQQRLENTPRREQELLAITRDYDATRELYASLLSRFDEAKLADSLEQRQKAERFRLLEPAVTPQEPAAPKRQRLLLMSCILSLGLAAGGVLLREILDTSLHRVEDLKMRIHVPVLATIPKIVTAADRSRQRRRKFLGVFALTVSLAALASASHWVATGNQHLVRFFVNPSSGLQLRK